MITVTVEISSRPKGSEGRYKKYGKLLLIRYYLELVPRGIDSGRSLRQILSIARFFLVPNLREVIPFKMAILKLTLEIPPPPAPTEVFTQFI